MNSSDPQSQQGAPSQQRPEMHGAHLRALEAVFRHPPAQNLEWMDVLGLIARIGVVNEKGDNKFAFDVGGQHLLMHKPHTKDLTSSDVADLRHFLQRAGWSPQGRSRSAASPEPAAPTLLVVVDHHGAKIYRIDTARGAGAAREIRPYDPHHFLHHLTHKEESRQQGQRAPEEAAFYQQIGDALAAGGRIVVIGHGTGKSNAAQYLIEYLRNHRRETYERIVREISTDLSAATTPQLLALAEQALDRAP
ncbi:MAG TPA: hypothetical protein VNX02_06960 [Steroidobacteraceae bacterium]|jgi:hypothetical protein|nr:hypothetical protein [Steroidobacteraceae bacterium]